ncbi:MAG: 2Fe-2S iron-sulfur cluster binding domain-containing protein, partial [bacterium]|nr:2Fe-2S iron-sulfur cluster binding domain-containing protein [bacterium]
MKKEPIKLIINEREVAAAVPAGTVTLDFIRQHQKLPGTKEGCREGECGACTVLVGELTDNDVQYKAVASCLLPLGELEGKHLVTVEGINCTAPLLTPIQRALADEGASQCGFCTPGIVLALTGYFISAEKLGCRAAIDAMDGNICRCTGYVPIRRAARKLCSTFTPQLEENKSRIHQMVQWSILPYYFLQIPERLKMLNDEIEAHPADSADSGVIVAGGTDLYVQQPEELVDKNLEFISRRKDLAGIKREKNKIVIGAATTTEEMKQSPLVNEFFPNMADYLSLVSSTIMRNRATLAGNIVNASPIGDLTIILLALDARLSLVNRKDKKKRNVPLKKFFKGY